MARVTSINVYGNRRAYVRATITNQVTNVAKEYETYFTFPTKLSFASDAATTFSNTIWFKICNVNIDGKNIPIFISIINSNQNKTHQGDKFGYIDVDDTSVWKNYIHDTDSGNANELFFYENNKNNRGTLIQGDIKISQIRGVRFDENGKSEKETSKSNKTVEKTATASTKNSFSIISVKNNTKYITVTIKSGNENKTFNIPAAFNPQGKYTPTNIGWNNFSTTNYYMFSGSKIYFYNKDKKFIGVSDLGTNKYSFTRDKNNNIIVNYNGKPINGTEANLQATSIVDNSGLPKMKKTYDKTLIPIQQFLKNGGYYTWGNGRKDNGVDGYLGPNTQAAISAYMKQNNIATYADFLNIIHSGQQPTPATSKTQQDIQQSTINKQQQTPINGNKMPNFTQEQWQIIQNFLNKNISHK